MPKDSKLSRIEVSFSAGKDFQAVQFQGTERLSRPFSFSLRGFLARGALNFDTILKADVGITLQWDDLKRSFHGTVAQIAEENTVSSNVGIRHLYRLTLVPRFDFLKHTQDCRIFLDKSALEIIQDLLKEKKIPFRDQTRSCGRRKREFCVQYNESYFDFLSRLMEEEGIFYFFNHTASEHTLVLADDPSALVFLKPATIPLERARVGHAFPARMLSFQKSQQVVPDSLTTKDFYFCTPEKKFQMKSGSGDHDIFFYPGRFPLSSQSDPQTEGEAVVKRTLESLRVQRVVMEGRSTAPQCSAGKKFTLQEHPQSALNTSYILWTVEHMWGLPKNKVEDVTEECLAEGALYDNIITAFSADSIFRPQEVTPKPRILGTQTAIVTGPADKELWTDEHGRVKLKFHWDKSPTSDDKCSAWVRVATPLAGQGWGVVMTPRIGQEVLVVFTEGNPDRPIVVGCLFNGLHTPPYPLPQDVTKSTFKSRSTPKGEGFNEIRFEDLKDKEEIYVHAQKDAHIEVQDSLTTDVLKGSQKTVIHRGDRCVTLRGEKDPTSGRGDDSLILTTGSQTVDLQAKNGKAHQAITLANGDSTLTIKQGNHSVILKSGNHSTTLSNGHLKLTVSGGNITIETNGMGDINLKAGGQLNLTGRRGVSISSSVAIDVGAKAGVTIQGGPFVTVKGGLIKLN